MGQADHARTTRRGMLAATFALSTAAGAAGVLAVDAAIGGAKADEAAPHPDATLLALGRELDALWAEEQALFATCDEDAPEIAAIEARCDAVIRRIVPIGATTLDGFVVKARACSYCHNGEPITEDTFEHGTVVSIQIVGLMVRDLLAIDAARVPA